MRRNAQLSLVGLNAMMESGSGAQDIVVAIVDGPVATGHPSLADAFMRTMERNLLDEGTQGASASSSAVTHGTFIAGTLFASRSSEAPGICPTCTMLTVPIFNTLDQQSNGLPSASSKVLAEAIVLSVDAGAHVLNISAGVFAPSPEDERAIRLALDYAMRSGAIVVAASGNQGQVGSSVITRHPWVVPVSSCDSSGTPAQYSNVSRSIGTSGLRAPGEDVVSLGAPDGLVKMSGTSAATPFVTGTAALLWSLFPNLEASEIRLALTLGPRRRATLIPPLLNAAESLERLTSTQRRGVTSER